MTYKPTEQDRMDARAYAETIMKDRGWAIYYGRERHYIEDEEVWRTGWWCLREPFTDPVGNAFLGADGNAVRDNHTRALARRMGVTP